MKETKPTAPERDTLTVRKGGSRTISAAELKKEQLSTDRHKFTKNITAETTDNKDE